MKLITELNEDVSYLEEDAGNGKKNMYITGVFLQSAIQNRNGRIYPEEVMDREVARYIKESVNTKRAMGELGHPCFGPTAEALTQTGWKYIKDVVEGELVYTIEPVTKTIQLQQVQKVHINHYKGDMIRIFNNDFNTTVTPYHRFLIYKRDGKPTFITAQEMKDGLDSKNSALAHSGLQKKTNHLDVVSPKRIVIGDDEASLTIDAKIFAGFLGLYLAEGCVKKVKGRLNSYGSSVSQNLGIKSEKIDKLLSDMTEDCGVKWARSEKTKHYGTTHVSWNTCSRILGKYLHQFGICYDKYVEQRILDSFDRDLSKEFLIWFSLGDGRGFMDTPYSACDVFTTSKKLSENLSMLAIRAGYACRMYTLDKFTDYDFAGHRILGKNRKPLHFVKILQSSGMAIDSRFVKTEYVPYDADVYCLQTENSTFLVRDNNYSFWTGNCGPQINLDRVSHLIVDLRKEGTDYHGKARLADTPSGRTAMGLINCGAQIGVSSRALGSLKQVSGIMEVQSDFRLSTAADIVADPSAPAALVQGIMEGLDFVYDEAKNIFVEQKIEEIKREIKSIPRHVVEERKARMFESYLETLSKR
jgi:copper chaperone CopZ